MHRSLETKWRELSPLPVKTSIPTSAAELAEGRDAHVVATARPLRATTGAHDAQNIR
jgi:hypothetical protein